MFNLLKLELYIYAATSEWQLRNGKLQRLSNEHCENPNSKQQWREEPKFQIAVKRVNFIWYCKWQDLKLPIVTNPNYKLQNRPVWIGFRIIKLVIVNGAQKIIIKGPQKIRKNQAANCEWCTGWRRSNGIHRRPPPCLGSSPAIFLTNVMTKEGICSQFWMIFPRNSRG